MKNILSLLLLTTVGWITACDTNVIEDSEKNLTFVGTTFPRNGSFSFGGVMGRVTPNGEILWLRLGIIVLCVNVHFCITCMLQLWRYSSDPTHLEQLHTLIEYNDTVSPTPTILVLGGDSDKQPKLANLSLDGTIHWMAEYSEVRFACTSIQHTVFVFS